MYTKLCETYFKVQHWWSEVFNLFISLGVLKKTTPSNVRNGFINLINFLSYIRRDQKLNKIWSIYPLPICEWASFWRDILKICFKYIERLRSLVWDPEMDPIKSSVYLINNSVPTTHSPARQKIRSRTIPNSGNFFEPQTCVSLHNMWICIQKFVYMFLFLILLGI